MSPSSMCTHIPQPLDILLQLPPQVVLNGHVRELRRQVEHLLVRQATNFRCRVDVEFGHYSLSVLLANAIERLESALKFGEDLKGYKRVVGRKYLHEA